MGDILKELAEPCRRAILHELKTGPKIVTDIVAATGKKQPNISNHLAKLRSSGIVRASKVGRQVFYSFATPEIEAAIHGLLADQSPEAPLELSLDDAAVQYARAGVAGDEMTCTRIIDSLIRSRIELIEVYEGVLSAAMYHIGKWYEVQAIDAGQEHLASAITERMMARVVHYAGQPAKNAGLALLGCVPGNWHTIGLRMISDTMRLAGWRTMYMGANVPCESFLSAAVDHSPDVILLSCATEEMVADTFELVEKLASRRGSGANFRLVVGGRAVATDSKRFLEAGVDFIASDLRSFSHTVLPALQ